MSDDLVLDLSNYKDRVGSKVPEDTYAVQVEDVERTESSNGNPMINVWFTILEGEFAGSTITDRLVLTEKSLFRVVGFMQAIGLPTPKQKLKLNIRQFVGRTLNVDIADGEPYNGRVRSEVKGYSKIPGGTSSASDPLEDLAAEQAEEKAAPAQAETEQAPASETPKESTPASTASNDSDDVDLSDVEL